MMINNFFPLDCITYIRQDSMAIQLSGIDKLYHNISLGHNWLLEMGAAADQLGISLQYGRTYPRQALQALEIQSVTQVC